MIDNRPTMNLFGTYLSLENQCNAKIKLTKTCKQRKPVGKHPSNHVNVLVIFQCLEEKISVTKRVRKFK